MFGEPTMKLIAHVQLVNMKKEKSNAQDFADTIRDNPKEIIAWAKREIAEYQKLIELLENQHAI